MKKIIDESKTIRVSKLKNGTVIDHLKAGTAFKTLKVLGIGEDCVLSIGMNFDSGKYGKKDIIKIENYTLSSNQLNKIAIISPYATYCIVKDYQVIQKEKVRLPDILENIVRCNNPRCITCQEKVNTRFYVLKKDPIQLKCHYCEKRMDEMELELII
ncbi:MAG: aspartate carbamoyltransferase regulatory subunit [Candidatus Delongbacteria bacterium]|nr:aspartate carbamoyltransferase regulatory subunit [Candidatus Delongbacteria bacterium]